MGKRRDRTQGGETGHAEDGHGEKTHKAFLDNIQNPVSERELRPEDAERDLKEDNRR